MNKKPLKLFFSYSHEDDSYLKQLINHLAPLKKSGVIDEWTDRELVVGDELEKEILTELQEADLVAFLVSSDFLSSFFGYEIELMETINRMSHSDVRIIPIIVRPCAWKETVLKKFVASPANGKPMSKWDDFDDACVDVMEKIKLAAHKLAERREIAEVQDSRKDKKKVNCVNEINQDKEFLKFLNDTEILFTNRYKDQVTLDDIYVFPDLVDEKKEYENIENYVNARLIIERIEKFGKVLIHGQEQSGKTSLAKRLSRVCFDKDILPVFSRGDDLTTSDIKKILKRALKAQYDELELEKFLQMDRKKALIIDDFHLIKLNSKYQPKLLNSINEYFDFVVIVSDSSVKYDESRFVQLSNFYQFKILPFGHVKRAELIEKWNSLGRQETIPFRELCEANDIATRYIDSIIKKNVIPPKPVYILTILHLLDAKTPTDLGISSYGHCYQVFIQQALERVGVSIQQFDTCINYLSELAFFLYEREKEFVTADELSEFQALYDSKYLAPSHDLLIAQLVDAGVIRNYGDRLSFGYRYIFYFYAAKYFTDHLEMSECKKAIEKLCHDIHSERNANILVFVVHHSKDPQIIEEILVRSSTVFDGVQAATLKRDEMVSLERYVVGLPKLILEHRKIEEERRKQLEAKDRAEGVSEDETGMSHDEEDTKKDIEAVDQDETLADISRSARLIEVIGQLLRNRHGSLPTRQLRDLAESAYITGLKFLGFYLEFLVQEEDAIIDLIENYMRENSSLSKDVIEKNSRRIFLMMCYTSAYSVIKKIANSLGSESLMPVFDELRLKYSDSPAVQLIDIAIKMEFTKAIPKKEIRRLNIELEKNPIPQRLLHELVVRHLYLNPVIYEDRNWIASTLGLKMQKQRLIQVVKKERL